MIHILKKHSFFYYWLSVFLFALSFSYLITFASAPVFSSEVGIVFKLSNNIYTDSTTLNKNRVVFNTYNDINDYLLDSDCNIYPKLIEYGNDSYLFEIKFLDNLCTSNRIKFIHRTTGETFSHKYNILSESEIYSKLIDYNDDRLITLQTAMEKQIRKNKFSGTKDSQEKLIQERRVEELEYNKKILEDILERRKIKYILPIDGEELNYDHSKVPNAGRPYRSSYTDGIHHGWDIGHTFGQEVIALDKGIVIRVVDGFQFSDLNKIKRGKNLGYEDKLLNLDILRGNQVWLKTMKGDVVMYSHLDKIYSGIKEGTLVHPKQGLGTVGVTGVPEIGYDDYHLHFTIHKNPYSTLEAGKYTFLDYMKWDWYFKGEQVSEVLKKQPGVFSEPGKLTHEHKHEKEG